MFTFKSRDMKKVAEGLRGDGEYGSFSGLKTEKSSELAAELAGTASASARALAAVAGLGGSLGSMTGQSTATGSAAAIAQAAAASAAAAAASVAGEDLLAGPGGGSRPSRLAERAWGKGDIEEIVVQEPLPDRFKVPVPHDEVRLSDLPVVPPARNSPNYEESRPSTASSVTRAKDRDKDRESQREREDSREPGTGKASDREPMSPHRPATPLISALKGRRRTSFAETARSPTPVSATTSFAAGTSGGGGAGTGGAGGGATGGGGGHSGSSRRTSIFRAQSRTSRFEEDEDETSTRQSMGTADTSALVTRLGTNRFVKSEKYALDLIVGILADAPDPADDANTAAAPPSSPYRGAISITSGTGRATLVQPPGSIVPRGARGANVAIALRVDNLTEAVEWDMHYRGRLGAMDEFLDEHSLIFATGTIRDHDGMVWLRGAPSVDKLYIAELTPRVVKEHEVYMAAAEETRLRSTLQTLVDSESFLLGIVVDVLSPAGGVDKSVVAVRMDQLAYSLNWKERYQSTYGSLRLWLRRHKQIFAYGVKERSGDVYVWLTEGGIALSQAKEVSEAIDQAIAASAAAESSIRPVDLADDQDVPFGARFKDIGGQDILAAKARIKARLQMPMPKAKPAFVEMMERRWARFGGLDTHVGDDLHHLAKSDSSDRLSSHQKQQQEELQQQQQVDSPKSRRRGAISELANMYREYARPTAVEPAKAVAADQLEAQARQARERQDELSRSNKITTKESAKAFLKGLLRADIHSPRLAAKLDTLFETPTASAAAAAAAAASGPSTPRDEAPRTTTFFLTETGMEAVPRLFDPFHARPPLPSLLRLRRGFATSPKPIRLPAQIEPSTVLRHVVKLQISAPKDAAKRERVAAAICGEATCGVLQDGFWFALCDIFRPGEFLDDQEVLFTRMARSFCLLYYLVEQRDMASAFSHLLDVMAQSLYLAFHLAFPGSEAHPRGNIFDLAFRQRISLMVQQWIGAPTSKLVPADWNMAKLHSLKNNYSKRLAGGRDMSEYVMGVTPARGNKRGGGSGSGVGEADDADGETDPIAQQKESSSDHHRGSPLSNRAHASFRDLADATMTPQERALAAERLRRAEYLESEVLGVLQPPERQSNRVEKPTGRPEPVVPVSVAASSEKGDAAKRPPGHASKGKAAEPGAEEDDEEPAKAALYYFDLSSQSLLVQHYLQNVQDGRPMELRARFVPQHVAREPMSDKEAEKIEGALSARAASAQRRHREYEMRKQNILDTTLHERTRIKNDMVRSRREIEKERERAVKTGISNFSNELLDKYREALELELKFGQTKLEGSDTDSPRKKKQAQTDGRVANLIEIGK
jgi:hypothetical protein